MRQVLPMKDYQGLTCRVLHVPVATIDIIQHRTLLHNYPDASDPSRRGFFCQFVQI